MLSFLAAGSSGFRSASSGTRTYSTDTSSAPTRTGYLWKHSHASSTPQKSIELPESQYGVAPELIAKMRRLRNEAPKTFTARRLESNFNLDKKTINRVAPYVKYGTMARSQAIEERRKARVVESSDVKRERLNAWWHKQFNDVQAHRERRRLYHTRGNKCMAEVDEALLRDADNRDYHADMIAENARNKKRKSMAANRRKR